MTRSLPPAATARISINFSGREPNSTFMLGRAAYSRISTRGASRVSLIAHPSFRLAAAPPLARSFGGDFHSGTVIDKLNQFRDKPKSFVSIREMNVQGQILGRCPNEFNIRNRWCGEAITHAMFAGETDLASQGSIGDANIVTKRWNDHRLPAPTLVSIIARSRRRPAARLGSRRSSFSQVHRTCSPASRATPHPQNSFSRDRKPSDSGWLPGSDNFSNSRSISFCFLLSLTGVSTASST